VSFIKATVDFVAQQSDPATRASEAGPDDSQLTHTRRIAGWAIWTALYCCLGAILYGAASWGLGSLGGNSGGASKGKTYVIAGFVGAVVLGVSSIAVERIYQQSVGA